MKNLGIFLMFIFLFSCSAQKDNPKGNAEINSTKKNLTVIESDITNHFLKTELDKERYKNYNGYDIFIIEEALKKMKPLSDYEFNLKYKDSWGKSIKNWILDTIQVKDLKFKLEKEEVYHWKISDFKIKKVSLYKNEELMTIINTSAYTNLPKRLIIFLSKPLILNDNNALISFDIGNGELGNSAITHFTVLMEKVNNNWEEKEYFHDDVFY
ncbi:hypothetical protein [Flavobacterium sp.]|uniref:hypothetical protein n=1 Tax=Flavobacterium sp. TaxID=239 RepID=UPI0025E5DEC0|nr:hypothetical protein [Flavobacterium sp.]